MTWIITGVLQGFDEERLTDIRNIRREFSHLVGLSAIGILECYSHHLVCLHITLQRYISQGTIQGVLRSTEQSGTLQFLIVNTANEARYGIQYGGCRIDTSRTGIVAHHLCVLGIGLVGGNLLSGNHPVRIAHRCILSQVRQCDDITGVCGGSRLIGHPYLDTVDGNTSGDIRQRSHGTGITVTEISGEEKVAVLFIISGIDLKGRRLDTTFRGDTLRRGFLLRDYRLQFQLTKLPIRTYTEERRCSPYQRGVAGERHVTTLYQFDNLIFLTIVFQFQALRIEVEGSIGVVVKVHIHLVTHPTVYTEVNLLIEVHRGGLTVSDRQGRVVDTLHRGAKLQFCRSLCLDAHATRAKDLLRGS